MKLVEEIAGFSPEIAILRREIHAHPELCYQEHRTAELVATKLTGWGIEVSRGLGGTGVVGTIRGTIRAGGGTRSIGLRADMDALPMTEHNGFEHRSSTPGRMHACGHDGHVAMLLAAARHLSANRNFDGAVHLIFQPAEEGGGGARQMIEDGLFKQFPCDAVFGVHNWPGLAVGEFAVAPGPVMASSNEFEIVITGKGGHAANPHLAVDPVLVACQMVMALQTVVTRNKKPIDSAVLSVTQIHTGETSNVIPDTAAINGTVRTFNIEALDVIEQRMREIVAGLPPVFGASATLDFHRNYPPTINHERESLFAREVLIEMVGEAAVQVCEPTMGSEDFSYMLLERPGSYVLIGNGDGAHRASGHGDGPCTLHNPNYDFNDDLIPLGASFWVRLVEKFLPRAA